MAGGGREGGVGGEGEALPSSRQPRPPLPPPTVILATANTSPLCSHTAITTTHPHSSSRLQVSVVNADSAFYSYPSVTLPAAFCDEAASKGIAPDVLYCLELLDATGQSGGAGSRTTPPLRTGAEAAGSVRDPASHRVPPDYRASLPTGIATNPGSGFGQAEGTFHFRTTILPPEDSMATFLESISQFQRAFMAKWSQGGGPLSRL